VICPFVFLLTSHNIPALKLQPTEVAAAHWVSLSSLLLPQLRTSHCTAMSLPQRNNPRYLARAFERFLMGQITFPAIRLVPSESLYSDYALYGHIAEPVRGNSSMFSPTKTLSGWWTGGDALVQRSQEPLLLWGLTLGVLEDLLHLVSPCTTLKSWVFPTLTSPDVRVYLWVMTYQFRRRKQRYLDHAIQSLSTANKNKGLDKPDEKDNHGEYLRDEMGIITHDGYQEYSRSHIAGVMMDRYYDYFLPVAILAMSSRALLASVFIYYVTLKNRSR
jgi:hypothetical protein